MYQLQVLILVDMCFSKCCLTAKEKGKLPDSGKEESIYKQAEHDIC